MTPRARRQALAYLREARAKLATYRQTNATRHWIARIDAVIAPLDDEATMQSIASAIDPAQRSELFMALRGAAH